MLIRTLIAVLLLSMFMVACGEDDDSTKDLAYPRIRLLYAPGAQHAAITRVVISVSARDMDTEEFDLDISDDGKTASGAISVISGSNRLFTVTVYSADGVESTGEELVAFLEPGTELLLEINMSGTSPPAINDMSDGEPVSMEEVIRATLDKPEGQLTNADYANVTEIYIWDLFDYDTIVTDLTGIERCTNLTYLVLYNLQVSDLNLLGGLTDLQNLFLSGKPIANISALAGLPRLDYLSLWDTGITDFSPLASISSLRFLFLGGANVDDSALRAATRLPSLEGLNLWDTGITDFSPLASMTSLRELYLEGKSVGDSALQIAARLPSLTSLFLLETGITDFSPLANMTKLVMLSLEGKSVNNSTLQIVARLSSLEYLELWNTEITDLSPLLELPNLGLLDILNTPLSARSVSTYIPQLEANGVNVDWDNESAQSPPAMRRGSRERRRRGL